MGRRLEGSGIEARRLITRVAQKQWPLRRVGTLAARAIRFGPTLVALHAQVDVDVRRVDGEAELPGERLAIRALGRPMRVVADPAGDAEVVIAASGIPLGIVGDYAPGPENPVPLVTRRAARTVVGHVRTVLLL